MEGISQLRVPLPMWSYALITTLWWLIITRYDCAHVKASIIFTRLIQFPVYLPHSSLPVFNHSSSVDSSSTTGREPATTQVCPSFGIVCLIVCLLLVVKNMDSTFQKKKKRKFLWNTLGVGWIKTLCAMKTQCRSGLFPEVPGVIWPTGNHGITLAYLEAEIVGVAVKWQSWAQDLWHLGLKFI